MKKEQWVDKVLTSLDKTNGVKAPDYLFDRIIQQSRPKVIAIQWVIGVAASFLFLVFLNIQLLSSEKILETNESTGLIEELNVYSTNQFYQ